MSGGGATTKPMRRPGARILGEGADVDDHAGVVGAGEREDGAAVVVELVVVVVLEDGGAVRLRQREEGEAPAGREDGGGRVLVVRGDVDGAHALARGELFQGVDAHAGGVDGDGHEARAGEAERLPRGAVAEGLDGDDVPRGDEGAGGEVERHLAAAGDEHRLRPGGEAAHGGDHGGDGGAQALVAAGVAVVERAAAALAGGAEGAAVGARQERRGDEAHVGHAAGEDEHAPQVHGEGERLGGAALEIEAEAGGDGGAGRDLPGEAAGRGLGQGAGDEGAARGAGVDPPLGGELAVGGEHRVAVHAERPGERAAARQLRAGGEAAAADVGRDGARDLEEDGLLGGGIEGEGELPGHRAGLP